MSRKQQRRDYLIPALDDGLLTYDVGPWAQDKYRRLGMYAEIFATGMKASWDTRVYLDLFSGPGYSQFRGSKKVVMGSPLIALSLPDPFDRYILMDENPEAVSVLAQRVARLAPVTDVRYLTGNANERVEEIIEKIPGGKTLSFCFLDPYKLNIHFDTVRRLATGRAMDFLILLALHVDANRNIDLYVDEESNVIDGFLGDTLWRGRWANAKADRTPFVAFLAQEYSTRMQSIGYLPMSMEQMVKIRTNQKRLPLYYLAFFSKHQKGVQFWQEVLKYSDDQIPLL